MKLKRSQIVKALPGLHKKALELGYVGSADNGKKILTFLRDEEVTVNLSGKAIDLDEALSVLESAAEQIVELDVSEEVEGAEMDVEEEIVEKSLKPKATKKLSDAVQVKAINRQYEIYKKKIARGKAKFSTPEAAEFYGALARTTIMEGKNYSMKDSDKKILEIHGKANTGTTGSAGGDLYNEEFWPELLELRSRYGAARQLLTVRNGQRDKWDEPVYVSGPTVYKPGQATAITPSDLVFDQINLVGETYATLTLASNELINSSQVDFADECFDAAFDALAKVEDAQIFGGDGTSANPNFGKSGYTKLFGDNVATYAGVQAASGVAWSNITKANVDATLGKLRARFHPNASIVCSRAFYFEVLVSFLDADASLVEREGRLNFQYRGFPVIFDESGAMPTATGDGSDVQVPMLVGDFSFGRILSVAPGMQMESSREYAFNLNATAFRALEQRDFGIVPTVGNASESGSVVALYTPATGS